MPLSKPALRKHIHTRRIECRGFERDDGLWDIEGSMVDTKTYSFANRDRGGVNSGEAIHHMLVRLTVDEDLVVRAVEAVTEAAPFTVCGDITAGFKALEGLRVAPGWRKGVLKRFGGVKGCTHLTDMLLGPLAATAWQTVIPARQKRSGTGGGKPALIDTCHAFASDGAVVKARWPEFHRER